MILSPDDLRACFVDELPARLGVVFFGVGYGRSAIRQARPLLYGLRPGALSAGWHSGIRFRCGNVASVNACDYTQMEQRGEIKTYQSAITPVHEFMSDIAADLAGCRVSKLAADGYKDAEIQYFLDKANLRWPSHFQASRRGQRRRR